MEVKIIDNFLTKKDFDYLKKIKVSKINNNEVKIYSNKIDKLGNIVSSCISPNFIKRLQKNYHPKAIKILSKFFPEKLKLYDYSEFFIQQTGKNYKFPIHDDVPTKLLSGVVYLSPKINIGTIFYKNNNGEGKKIIEWKENRGVFFTRKERETWHSFEGDGISSRLVLVYNLMTSKVQKVYNLEKKNYYLGLLRYKLNPYLLKYLRFTI